MSDPIVIELQRQGAVVLRREHTDADRALRTQHAWARACSSLQDAFVVVHQGGRELTYYQLRAMARAA